MRVISTQATTPNGNKYNNTRLGRIIGTTAFTTYGAYQAKKLMNSDEFINELEQAAKTAAENKRTYYKGARKAALIGTTAAIMAVCGFLVGGAVDFVVNRISKKKADEKKA